MTREQLLAELAQLADRASPEHPAIAGILYTVCGALVGGKEWNLAGHVEEFTDAEIERLERIKAQWN